MEEMGEAGARKKAKVDEKLAAETETDVATQTVHNITNSSSDMDWSSGDPATPPGGSSTPASGKFGLGANVNNPRVTSDTEQGAQQLPGF